MEKEAQSASSLQSFIHMVGIPWALHSDNAKVYTQGEFQRKCSKYDIAQSFTEPHSPWQNRAETGIREVKSFGRKLMTVSNAPIRLWCFAYEYAADVLSLMAVSKFELGGRTPYEHVMNYTPDISEYTTFKWYQWSYYWDEHSKQKKLCRWLGVAHEVGQAMCYWILIENGEFLARSTVIPIPPEDHNSEEIASQMALFDSSVHEHIGDYRNAIVREGPLNDATIYHDAMFDSPTDDEVTFPWDTELEELALSEQSDASMAQLDEYIGAQMVVPGKNGEGDILAKEHSRKRNSSGRLVGEAHPNPILDTRVFNIEFPDGHVEEYATNVVAENLYSQVDENGFDTGIFDEIVDHRSNDQAVKVSDGLVMVGNTLRPVITTKGWQLKVKWKDGSYDWLPLSQLKESNPVQVAEYACAHSIHREPAFNWWVQKILRKRDRLINKVSTRRMRKGSMKFGVEVPRTVKEALELDRKNGNTFWADAIKKELESIKVAFNVLGKDDVVPPGYSEITCHLIFDVKFDLTRKARYVAGGHLTDAPPFMTYASVVSRESVRIAFLVVALNGLDILSGDIGNAYLNEPTKKKIWFRAGDEFGSQAGQPVIIVRALYGLKGSANAWRSMLSSTMRHDLGIKACLADPDVWYKPAVKVNGDEYYVYILIYTDDLLIVAEDPQKYMDIIKSKYFVKPESIGPPKVYLGANIQLIPSRVDGKECWGASAEQYVRNAVNNVKAKMAEDGFRYNKKLSDVRYSPQQPFSAIKYRPELDTTLECDDAQANYYQNLIGVLRWIVELGRVDIQHEVAVLSQYLANPRVGHLSQALHIFKFLDIHKEGFIAFDPAYLELSENDEKESDIPELRAAEMKDFYPDAKETLPPNAPSPRGLPVQINTFVDADHAGNLVTRRSHTGILIFLNLGLIDWFSKRQNTVESSTFSSEFVALKIAVEKVIALHYKLRMMGIPIEGPARMFCDNEAVYKNASYAVSTLRKKHNSIAYHKVWESVAADIAVVIKENTDTNLADLLTKSTHSPDRRKFLRSCLMRQIKID
jgi:hypothetical protein